MTLQDFTDQQLRDELKRRLKERQRPEHCSKKALKSIACVPRFKGRAGALAVVFYPR